MILKPDGWFNGLTIRDKSDHALRVNRLNLGHDDNIALLENEQGWVLSRAKFLYGHRVILRIKPYLEVFNLSKLLVPGVQIKFKCT